jgi:hypothetical protein
MFLDARGPWDAVMGRKRRREVRRFLHAPAWVGCPFDPRAQRPVDLELCRFVVADHLELGDDFAARLFFLDLLGQEPLELDDRRVGLGGERQLVERFDLLADGLLLLEGVWKTSRSEAYSERGCGISTRVTL